MCSKTRRILIFLPYLHKCDFLPPFLPFRSRTSFKITRLLTATFYFEWLLWLFISENSQEKISIHISTYINRNIFINILVGQLGSHLMLSLWSILSPGQIHLCMRYVVFRRSKNWHYKTFFPFWLDSANIYKYTWASTDLMSLLFVCFRSFIQTWIQSHYTMFMSSASI